MRERGRESERGRAIEIGGQKVGGRGGERVSDTEGERREERRERGRWGRERGRGTEGERWWERVRDRGGGCRMQGE